MYVLRITELFLLGKQLLLGCGGIMLEEMPLF